MDGLSRLGVWWRVAIPMSRPALAAVAMLVIFPVAAPALADTVVPGNGTPVIVPDVPSIGANLDFIAGTGDPAVLQLLTGGIYSGEWSINNVPAIFDLNGGSLVIAPSVGAGTATGDANVGVVNGTLQLGTNSFLTGFGTSGAGGTLSAIQGGRLVVDDAPAETAAPRAEAPVMAGVGAQSGVVLPPGLSGSEKPGVDLRQPRTISFDEPDDLDVPDFLK